MLEFVNQIKGDKNEKKYNQNNRNMFSNNMYGTLNYRVGMKK